MRRGRCATACAYEAVFLNTSACPNRSSDCPKGFYSDREGESDCAKALLGFKVNTTGSGKQFPCLKGSHGVGGDIDPRDRCTDCPAGWYQSVDAQASCEEADDGNYAPTPGTVDQIPCPVGKHGKGQPRLGCTDCPKGYIAATARLDGVAIAATARY